MIFNILLMPEDLLDSTPGTVFMGFGLIFGTSVAEAGMRALSDGLSAGDYFVAAGGVLGIASGTILDASVVYSSGLGRIVTNGYRDMKTGYEQLHGENFSWRGYVGKKIHGGARKLRSVLNPSD